MKLLCFALFTLNIYAQHAQEFICQSGFQKGIGIFTAKGIILSEDELSTKKAETVLQINEMVLYKPIAGGKHKAKILNSFELPGTTQVITGFTTYPITYADHFGELEDRRIRLQLLLDFSEKFSSQFIDIRTGRTFRSECSRL